MRPRPSLPRHLRTLVPLTSSGASPPSRIAGCGEGVEGPPCLAPEEALQFAVSSPVWATEHGRAIGAGLSSLHPGGLQGEA